MMDYPKADVALLTPVHQEHLISGLETSDATGFVAFGSDAALTLLELSALVDEEHRADILFYASHSKTGGVPRATYRGCFVAYAGKDKAKADWAQYRPPSTASDGNWTGFYLVQNLRRLEQPVLIASLKKRDGKGKFAKAFYPLGPIIIDTPF
jgi:hypothetical protein